MPLGIPIGGGGGTGGAGTPTATYDASTNTPDLVGTTPTQDSTWYVTDAGTQDFGAQGGVIELAVGDLLDFVVAIGDYIKRDRTPKASEIENDSTVTGATVKDALESNKTDIDNHVANDGSDHSFIDQEVTSGSSPTFDGTNFTGIPTAGLDDDAVTDDKLANTTLAKVNESNWAIKSGSYTAVASDRLAVDTNAGGVQIDLPATPTAGDIVHFKDYAKTWSTNNLTVGRNGENIEGLAEDLIVSTDGLDFSLTYIDATKGWIS